MKFAHWVQDKNYHPTVSSELVENFSVDGHEFYFSSETGEIIIFFFNKWPDESDYHFREKLGKILQRYRYSE